MATNYLHGVEVIESQDGPRPVLSSTVTAIGLVGTSYGPDREDLSLVSGLRAARDKYSAEGTILPAVEAILSQGAAPPIAVVQAFDASSDRSEVEGEELAWATVGETLRLARQRVSDVSLSRPPTETAVADKEVAWPALNASVALGNKPLKPGSVSIKTKAGSKAVAGSDYSVDEDAGTVTALSVTNVSATTAVLVSYTYLTPRPVADTDYRVDEDAGTVTVASTAKVSDGDPVLAAYSWADVSRTSVAAVVRAAAKLADAQPVLGVVPEILVAPGFTEAVSLDEADAIEGAPGATGLAGVAERLRAMVVADGPGTTRAAALAYRDAIGSRRVMVVDPKVKVAAAAGGTVEAPASGYVAGLMARSDRDRGWWASPSNQALLGIAGTSRPVGFILGDESSEANALNAAQVSTVIRRDGWRLWGGRTCSADSQWAFVSVVRTADRINRTLLEAHLWAVDRNVTRTYATEVVESVNAFLRGLEADGAILGGQCWADAELNTPQSVAAGRIYFDFRFTPAYPAERVTFRSRIVDDYVESIFT